MAGRLEKNGVALTLSLFASTAMNKRYLPRPLLLALALLPLVAACDTTGEPARVRAINFNFSMRDASVRGPFASVQFDVPEIAPRVAAGGAILCFFRDQDTWTAMPYTFGIENPDLPAVDYTLTLGYAFETRFLELFYEASTDQVNFGALPDRLVKLVIIDADVYSGKAGVDLTDWNQVKAAYGLAD